MKFGLNLLHLVMLVGVLTCVRLAASDLHSRSVRRSRLAWPAVLALACSAIFLLFHVGLRQPPWIFGLALAVGVLAGVARGALVPLEVDHMFERVRLPPVQVTLAATLVLAVAVALEIAGAVLGPPGLVLRHVASPLAAACAGFLSGRAVVIALRCRRAPHAVLHRF